MSITGPLSDQELRATPVPVSSSGLPASLGQKTMALSTPVVLASDQSAVQTVGSVASGSADSGNPVKIGGVAASTFPTSATAGQRKDQWVTLGGATVIGAVGSVAANGTSNTIVLIPEAANGAARLLGIAPFKSNGTTWDLDRKANTTSRIPSSAASTNATVAKASAGDVISLTATNTTASLKYLKIYNKATSPTVGTDTPVLTIPLQPSNIPTTISIPGGLYCSAGISYALTGAAADADTTALASGDVVGVNIVYA